MHRVMVAFGSNLGDRVSHIEAALQELNKRRVKVRAVSALYETMPMYVTEQATFLNGVCEVETDLDPLKLLDVLQQIENDLGRERLMDKGPRNIDLDILMYDYEHVDHNRLQIPHKLILEREFVLRPLADLIPYERFPPPFDHTSILVHLRNVEAASSDHRPDSVTAVRSNMPLIRSTSATRPTQLMAILNITPDSFSDGNVHSSTDTQAMSSTIHDFIKAGATIIDVGGQSTRPNATLISPQDELSRIIPVIKQIRTMPEAKNILISVDTFYAHVAEGAIGAGADIINDVTAGVADPLMLITAARLQRPIIIMHMRGTPSTMTKLTEYPNGVVEDVGRELLERVEAAKAAGIFPWRIILDPGIGFAKNQAQNLELLRRLQDLHDYPGLQGMPWLVGTSRKGFIGKITGVQKANERAWGTAAAVTASVRGGADIVRVHDVPEMAQVVKMADAMYRVADEKTSFRRAVDKRG